MGAGRQSPASGSHWYCTVHNCTGGAWHQSALMHKCAALNLNTHCLDFTVLGTAWTRPWSVKGHFT